MQIERLNKRILQFPPNHIARRFLEAFLACQVNCVGREIPFPGRNDDPLDQEWYSLTDKRLHSFSSFAYEYISFTIVLDGWLHDSKEATATEQADLNRLPYLRALMDECRHACDNCGNAAVSELVAQVQDMLALWNDCLRSRLSSMPNTTVNLASGSTPQGV